MLNGNKWCDNCLKRTMDIKDYRLPDPEMIHPDNSRRYLYRVDQYNYGQFCCVEGGEDVNPKYKLSFYDSKIYAALEKC